MSLLGLLKSMLMYSQAPAAKPSPTCGGVCVVIWPTYSLPMQPPRFSCSRRLPSPISDTKVATERVQGPSAMQFRDGIQPAQLVRVADRVYAGDPAVLDHEGERRARVAGHLDAGRDRPVEQQRGHR